MDLPEITINGKTRVLRRWGLSDIFKLQRVLGDIHAGATLRGLTIDFNSEKDFEANLLGLISTGMTFAEKPLTEWMQSWYQPIIENDEDIPLPDLMRTLELLLDHPDIQGFLANSEELAKKLFEKLSQKAQTLQGSLQD